MPKIIYDPNAKKAGSKKKGRFGWLSKAADVAGKIGSDLGDAARQTPGGVIQAATAIDQALPHGPIKRLERGGFERGGKHLDPTAIKAIGVGQIDALKNLSSGKAWGEHPGDNLLTLLGIAPIPGAALAKASKVSKAGRVAAKKDPPKRILKGKAKDDKQAQDWAKAKGYKNPEDYTTKSVFRIELPASGVNTSRAVQKSADKLRAKSTKLQNRKMERGMEREADIRKRRTDPADADFTAAVKNLKQGNFYKFGKEDGRNRAWEGLREGNSLIRGLRLYRPGYIAPNALGSRATNVIQMGLKSPGQARKSRQMNKGLDAIDPGLKRRRDVAMGDSGAQAIMASGAKNPDMLQGPVGTFMGGVGTSLSKVTDRGSRRKAFDFEAAKYGYDTPEKMAKLLEGGTAKLDSDFIQIVRRAEAAAVKFTRARPLPGRKQSAASVVDRTLADNIFLYKWLTGSAGYTGKMLSEHPTLTAALAAQGEEAPAIDSILPKAPDFLKSYFPYAKEQFDKLPKVSSTRALTLFDSPGEAVDLAGRIKEDPLNAITPLNPIQHAIGIGAAGEDPYFGAEPSQTEDGYTRSGRDVDLWNRAKWALDQETKSIPHYDLAKRLTGIKDPGGVFPMDDATAALRYSLGGFVPIPVDPEQAAKLYRKQEQKKKDKRGRKKNRKSGSSRY